MRFAHRASRFRQEAERLARPLGVTILRTGRSPVYEGVLSREGTDLRRVDALISEAERISEARRDAGRKGGVGKALAFAKQTHKQDPGQSSRRIFRSPTDKQNS